MAMFYTPVPPSPVIDILKSKTPQAPTSIHVSNMYIYIINFKKILGNILLQLK